ARRIHALHVDARLDIERTNAVDLAIEVAGAPIGAGEGLRRHAAEGDQASGRLRPDAREAVGTRAGSEGHDAEHCDEKEHDESAHDAFKAGRAMLVSQSDEDRTDSGAIERTVPLRERQPAKRAHGGPSGSSPRLSEHASSSSR